MTFKISRRQVLKTTVTAGMALAAPHVLSWPANAAEFTYKVANNLPASHPMNIRLNEAILKISEESGGQMELRAFPNSSRYPVGYFRRCFRRCRYTTWPSFLGTTAKSGPQWTANSAHMCAAWSRKPVSIR
jgi:hypothetical protein